MSIFEQILIKKLIVGYRLSNKIAKELGENECTKSFKEELKSFSTLVTPLISYVGEKYVNELLNMVFNPEIDEEKIIAFMEKCYLEKMATLKPCEAPF